MNYYGFQQIIKLPTHRRGGLLDHFYTNIGSESTGITITELYEFSYFQQVLGLYIHIPSQHLGNVFQL
jgi:hypothetical protein